MGAEPDNCFQTQNIVSQKRLIAFKFRGLRPEPEQRYLSHSTLANGDGSEPNRLTLKPRAHVDQKITES